MLGEFAYRYRMHFPTLSYYYKSIATLLVFSIFRDNKPNTIIQQNPKPTLKVKVVLSILKEKPSSCDFEQMKHPSSVSCYTSFP